MIQSTASASESISSKLNTGEWIAILSFVLTVIVALGALIIVVIKFSYKAGGIMAAIDKMVPLVDKIAVIEDRVISMWERKVTVSNSPMKLNEVGSKIFEDSGIFLFLEKHKEEIIKKVRLMNPSNAYQAQEVIITVLKTYKMNPSCIEQLEKGAFDSGSDVDTVLFVAAIAVRDEILTEMGFENSDIDNHDPKK